MPDKLFNIKYPDFKTGLTFEEFKNECLTLQRTEPERTGWVTDVSFKYLIPLLMSTPEGMEKFKNIKFTYQSAKLLRHYETVIDEIYPVEDDYFMLFEKLNEVFPCVINSYLKLEYLELKEKHDIIESYKTLTMPYLKQNNPLHIHPPAKQYTYDVVIDFPPFETTKYTFDEDTNTVTLMLDKDVFFNYGGVPCSLRSNLKNNTKKYKETIKHHKECLLLLKLKWDKKTDFTGKTFKMDLNSTITDFSPEVRVVATVPTLD